MLCEACCNNVWIIVDDAEISDRSVSAYHLCAECHKRLIFYALKPREWYNLVILHGSQMCYLHDDFYNDEGVAGQPKEEADLVEGNNAPSLKDVVHDLPRLIEFCTTKWTLSAPLIEALLAYGSRKVLQMCEEKLEECRVSQIKESLFEIAVAVCGDQAAPWTRRLWESKQVDYVTLCKGTAKSLPLDEAFDRIIVYLESAPLKDLPRKAFCCMHLLRSPKVIEWMEPLVTQYRDDWATLAATSRPTWACMQKWISRGRPFSHLAIETIAKCVPGLHYSYLAILNSKILDLSLVGIKT